MVTYQRPITTLFMRRRRLRVGELERGHRDEHLADREEQVLRDLPGDVRPAAPRRARASTSAAATKESTVTNIPTDILRSGVTRTPRRSSAG